MAASHKPKPKQVSEKNIKAASKKEIFSQNDIVPALLIFLFICVDFLPTFDSADIMGTQWLYLVIVNIISAIFIVWNKSQREAILHISRSTLTIIYTALFAWAALSILFAINRVEGLVGFSRFTATFIMYLNMAILLYSRQHLVKFIINIMVGILLIRSIVILVDFSAGVGTMKLDSLIFSLYGNTGNKNIMAASIIARIPFAIYGIYLYRSRGRLFNIFVLGMAVLVIFILNARSSYVGLILLLLVYFAGIIILAYQENTKKQLLPRIGFVLLPIIVAFIFAQFLLTNALKLQEETSVYGNVTNRLSTISFDAENSGNRTVIWGFAADHIKHHPVMGCGISNWKLASVPYEKATSLEFFVEYHCHNDFLEITAELGLPGGLLYLSLFVILFIYTLTTLFSSASAESKRLSLMSLMILAGYFVDAALNFPMERPIMQFFFALILALNLNTFLSSKEIKKNERQSFRMKILYGIVTTVVLIPALYITYSTYQSMVVQKRINPDLSSATPAYTSDDANELPDIPNLNVFALPIDAVKAWYFIQEKKYDTALHFLNKSINVNPYLPYSIYLKAAVFTVTGKLDSAFVYAKKAFYARPRAKTPYNLINNLALQLNDSVTVNEAYNEIRKYMYNDNYIMYNTYLATKVKFPHSKQKLLALCDSILKIHPDPDFQQRKIEIENTPENPSRENIQPSSTPMPADTLSQKGLTAFDNHDFKNAAKFFMQAAQAKPANFIDVENAAMSYYSLNDFKQALPLFDKVIQSNTIQNGKSEFFKGICLENTGRRDEGCIFLKKADAKNYPEAKTYIKTFCK